jgi:Asp-tRNA(Asn)/Glu-tRNA(Gln) amidotransferase A subunit family amidase
MCAGCASAIPTELWPYHEQFLDRQELYGPSFLERSLPGRKIDTPTYLRARETQEEVRREWRGVFERADIVMLPANVGSTVPHGKNQIEIDGKAYPLRTVMSPFHPLSNVTGFPSLVIPVGMMPDGLPIAIQLIGPPLSEKRLLAVGHRLEQSLGGLVARWGIEPRA